MNRKPYLDRKSAGTKIFLATTLPIVYTLVKKTSLPLNEVQFFQIKI